MPGLSDYLSRRGEVLVLILLVVLSVTLMLLSSTDKDRVARVVNDVLLTPTQATISRSSSLFTLRDENDSLRTRLAASALRIAELEEASLEAPRLRRMLDLEEHGGYRLLASRVIAREADRQGRDLKIDRGARHGIRKNLAVVTVDGLLGKVSEVGPKSAFVRPILARNCRVSARIQRTRTDGILEWTGENGLQLSFLPFRAEILPDDPIVSSGLGGVFPKGLRIGKVSRVDEARIDGSLLVRVEAAVDFSSVEEVFVVLGPKSFFASTGDVRGPFAGDQ